MAKTERLDIRLTTELKEQLQKAAADENRSLTNYIENVLIQALKSKSK